MPEDVPRMIVCAEVASIGCLSLIATYVMRGRSETQMADTLLLATLLLILACVGFIMKLIRRWSTRLLWEWIFAGATLLGGWILPRILIPGLGGSVVTMFVLFAPLVSQSFWLYVVVGIIGASGAAMLLAAYIPGLSLWVLWTGVVE